MATCLHIWNVQAACGDVRCNQYSMWVAAEAVECPQSLPLLLLSMQGRGREAQEPQQRSKASHS